MSKLTDKVKAVTAKVTVKKTVAPKVEKKKSDVCPNCENSGLSCSVCKAGRDDVATDVV